MFDPINAYFKLKGVDVCYNTLNSTDELIRAYIKDYQGYADVAKDNWSHHVKTSIYSSMYEFTPRQKLTGFEKFKNIDIKFRQSISPLITTSQFSDTAILQRSENSKYDRSYKETLIDRVKTFKNPLLYLSGGIDSELVANAMLEAGVKFTPVIFEFIDNRGSCRNINDVQHAYNFCGRHGLYAIVKKLDIVSLWQSREFAELAIALQIQSPHIVTHAWMIETLRHEYSGRSHIFGGEVRFYSNHKFESDVPANMVLLNKVAGLGINGINIVDEDFNPAPYNQTEVALYVRNDYQFRYHRLFYNSDEYFAWYNVTGTPSPTFYWAVTGINVINQTPSTVYFPLATTSYTAIGTENTVAYVTNNDTGGMGNIIVEFTISIYGSVGGVGTAISGTTTMEATHLI